MEAVKVTGKFWIRCLIGVMLILGLMVAVTGRSFAYDLRWYQPKFMASVGDAVTTVNQMLQKRSLSFYNGTEYTKIYDANVDNIGLRAFGVVNRVKTEQVWVPQGLLGGYYQVVQKPYQEEWRGIIDFSKIDSIEITANGQALYIWTGGQTSYWAINTGMEQDTSILANAIATLAVSSGSNLKASRIGFNYATDKELKKLRKELDWKGESNLIINEVGPGFPAEASGFQVKDIIVGINGFPVKNSDEVNAILKKAKEQPGDISITFQVVRGGKETGLKCLLPDFNRGREAITPYTNKPATTTQPGPQQPASLGVDLRAATESELAKAKVGAGLLVIGVNEGGLAARSGVRTNDILVEINGKPIKDIQQLKSILTSETPYRFKVIRDGAEMILDAVFSI
jgi:membrane-associated protease RseP (regulator of RpoE activity)